MRIPIGIFLLCLLCTLIEGAAVGFVMGYASGNSDEHEFHTQHNSALISESAVDQPNCVTQETRITRCETL